jgi:hypothetical protein
MIANEKTKTKIFKISFHMLFLCHYNNRGLFCDPNIIANNKERNMLFLCHYNNRGLFCDPNIIANNKERNF